MGAPRSLTDDSEVKTQTFVRCDRGQQSRRLAVGLFTRLAALIIWIEMGIIIVYFQWQFGYFWTVRGYEYALLWWLLCLAIFFRGGGRYAVDRLIGKEF
jgi:putative oxidoreductase